MKPLLHVLPVSLSGILAFAFSGTAGAEPILTRFAFNEPHMGTRFQIIVYALDETAARQASKAAFERIATLDSIMSDYRSTSELLQLCQKAGGPPVHVSDEL